MFNENGTYLWVGRMIYTLQINAFYCPTIRPSQENLSRSQSTERMVATASLGRPTVSKTITLHVNLQHLFNHKVNRKYTTLTKISIHVKTTLVRLPYHGDEARLGDSGCSDTCSCCRDCRRHHLVNDHYGVIAGFLFKWQQRLCGPNALYRVIFLTAPPLKSQVQKK